MVRRQPLGMALPLVLLLLLALAAFGQGILSLSLRELQATWAFRNLARAKTAAELGLRLAFEAPVDPFGEREPWVSQPLISGETEDGLIYRAHLRWLNEEFFLLEGVGGVRGWPGERKTAWIGWSLHPGVRLKAYLSFAEAGSLVVREGGPSLPVESLYRLPEGWPSWACPSPESLLDSLAGGALLPAMPSALGLEVEGSGSSRFPPSLGLLSGQELLRRADPWRAQGHFGGRGAEERGCPGGEGAAVFEGAQGDVLVEGGRVCGVLVTSGSLRIRGDGVWQGMALVGGDMVLEGAAGFEGLARVGGRLLLRGESTFRGSACAAFWALGGAPALRDPMLLHTGVVLDRF